MHFRPCTLHMSSAEYSKKSLKREEKGFPLDHK